MEGIFLPWRVNRWAEYIVKAVNEYQALKETEASNATLRRDKAELLEDLQALKKESEEAYERVIHHAIINKALKEENEKLKKAYTMRCKTSLEWAKEIINLTQQRDKLVEILDKVMRTCRNFDKIIFTAREIKEFEQAEALLKEMEEK